MQNLSARFRRRERVIGYWSVLDAPVAVEWLSTVGYDYIAVDAQHGLLGYSGMLADLMAVDAGAQKTGTVGLVRVRANTPADIGVALDAGASGVIVPMINSAEEAKAAVASAMYPPFGERSFGPMRSRLRIGPEPAVANANVAVLVMIETARGLDHLPEIAAVPGISGLYVGPSDLALGLGASHPKDPAVADDFERALVQVRDVASEVGIAAVIHTPDGRTAHRRLAQGFTGVTIASDLTHLEAAARNHLTIASATE
ncbi:aldolase/citrate lyase family protein [Georgenia halophila]|uniref:Aldolase/citrate lyase family protein n=1 Tax=Georgenia halophila TaxID=620889 RepID=A0ABP8LG84_9MICO